MAQRGVWCRGLFLPVKRLPRGAHVCFCLACASCLCLLRPSPQEPQYEHLTDEDRGKMKSACKEAEDWVAGAAERQSKLPLTADPAATIAEFDQIRRVRVCGWCGTCMVPHPHRDPPPPSGLPFRPVLPPRPLPTPPVLLVLQKLFNHCNPIAIKPKPAPAPPAPAPAPAAPAPEAKAEEAPAGEPAPEAPADAEAGGQGEGAAAGGESAPGGDASGEGAMDTGA